MPAAQPNRRLVDLPSLTLEVGAMEFTTIAATVDVMVEEFLFAARR